MIEVLHLHTFKSMPTDTIKRTRKRRLPILSHSANLQDLFAFFSSEIVENYKFAYYMGLEKRINDSFASDEICRTNKPSHAEALRMKYYSYEPISFIL